MSDILLTHDQQGDAIDVALKRCVSDRELSPVHTVAEEVSRAQVAKVMEWLEACTVKEGTEVSMFDTDWQTLRMAAGGG